MAGSQLPLTVGVVVGDEVGDGPVGSSNQRGPHAVSAPNATSPLNTDQTPEFFAILPPIPKLSPRDNRESVIER